MIGNAVWFEIPASNFERAVKFYEAVFQLSLKREKIGGDLAVFPGSDSSVNGAVVSQNGYDFPFDVGHSSHSWNEVVSVGFPTPRKGRRG